MDVFHIDSNISSSLVDDGTSGPDDITEVRFDAHSEFNLIFFDTPDDSTTQGGFSNPDSVESIGSIASSPPPSITPITTSLLYQSAQQQCQSLLQNVQATSSSSNPTSINQLQQQQQQQQQQHQQPLPILVNNIKNGKPANCLLIKNNVSYMQFLYGCAILFLLCLHFLMHILQCNFSFI